MNDMCIIENEFQQWLQRIKDCYSYVLCAPECAARYAFEAGFNTARQQYEESARTDKQQPQQSSAVRESEIIMGTERDVGTGLMRLK